MMLTREQAESRTILRALVGSTVHGLNVRDAVEDRDEMGVLVEPFDAVVGFTRFEQFIYRSAAEREGRADAKSRAGDLDLVIHSLRKYGCDGRTGGTRRLRLEVRDAPVPARLSGSRVRPDREADAADAGAGPQLALRVAPGGIPKPEMLARATEIEEALRAAIDRSPLPEAPDHAAVEAWMLRTYRRVWAEDDGR